MNYKTWCAIGLAFVVACGAWSGFVVSRRAFLQDFNSAVHAYLSGDFTTAEESLTRALARRPKSPQARQLLIKVLVERSFAQYHAKDYRGALDTLDRATGKIPPDDPIQRSLASLREQLAIPADQRPRNMEQVLSDLYRKLPEKSQPESLESMMQRWLDRSEQSQESTLKHFWDNQERWLLQLQNEKDEFKHILYGGLALFSVAGLGLIGLFVRVLRRYFGRQGVVAQLLDAHFQRLVAALPAGSGALLGPPVNLLHVPEARRMDFIEAEIVSGREVDTVTHELQKLLKGEDPWVRARAAKILYRLDPEASMNELKQLTLNTSSDVQVSGLWALTQLATADALDLLAPLAYSPSREIQQGTIRSLLQLQARADLASDVRQKLDQLLPEIRARTGWVF